MVRRREEGREEGGRREGGEEGSAEEGGSGRRILGMVGRKKDRQRWLEGSG
jgi:hypothetical protein